MIAFVRTSSLQRLVHPATRPCAQALIVRCKSVLADEQSKIARTHVPAGARAKTTASAGVARELEAESRPSAFAAALVPRFVATAEIAVSKIFPAGFGWQGASVVAEHAGFAADSFGFYTVTGAGDFAGVFLGHTVYFALKKAIVDKGIDLAVEVQTALLLASAAFGSGFVWQAALNAFQGHGASFSTAAVGTGLVCGATFFGGLRIARGVYPKLGMAHIEPPTYRNLRDDAALSVAIGGATGMFVGTDVSMPDNLLRGFVGIEDSASTLTGMAIAGKSTAVGFAAVQSGMNAFLPAGRNWLDQSGRE